MSNFEELYDFLKEDAVTMSCSLEELRDELKHYIEIYNKDTDFHVAMRYLSEYVIYKLDHILSDFWYSGYPDPDLMASDDTYTTEEYEIPWV